MANGIDIENWKGSIRYRADNLQRVSCIDDIVAVVQNRDRYPSPVRVKGSHHSTTRCVVAEGGTVIDITPMNRILSIDRRSMTIVMEAGVLHIDAAKVLEKLGLQFFVNVELGNLTVGSGACCATKDASYISDDRVEYGQVSSYCIGMKIVQADGGVVEVTEAEPERLALLRSSYGLLGVVVEVTYRVKPLRPMAVEHVRYSVDEFANNLDAIIDGGRSVMMYLFPFLDSVVVEYRYDGTGEIRSGSWQWRVRNWMWSKGSPAFGKIITAIAPSDGLRSWILDRFNGLSQWVVTRVLRGCNTSPADQIIRYAQTGGFAAYTFSIWAFPRESYGQTIKDYYQFCQAYFREHGYRCDLLNVGYSIAQDEQSVFSYTRRGPALTLDPVSTGSAGWSEYLTAYNVFCSEHDGMPLFNQTPGLTSDQAQAAFAPQIERFNGHRLGEDPDGRFLTPFFRELFLTDETDVLDATGEVDEIV